ncbi:MAG: redoxin domain-containing protein [Chloroflexi bacterium]|nr:redoxin domain-containing protein [Chloroflexota bacterium]
MSTKRISLAFFILIAFGILLAAACNSQTPAASPTTGIQESTATTESQQAAANQAITTGRIGNEKLAPELKAISGWLNTEPFALEDLRGQVVLVDFWTYTCINCIRTLPYLKDWHDKYADDGLVIVGVHTPEFDFEHIYENVEDAIAEYGLKYPVAQDNDYGTWRAFSNRYWPAKYLIDKDGYIRYTHFGEGAYEETEEWIRALLAEAGVDLSQQAFEALEEREFDPAVYTSDSATSLTRELYAGTDRNYAAVQFKGSPPYVRNLEFYSQPDIVLDYNDPGNYENHYIYLEGNWRNAEESVVHTRDTEGSEDYIAIKFYATSVNAVMAPPEGETATVVVTIEGQPLTQPQAGVDVMWDDAGRSYIAVNSSRMYNVVEVSKFAGYDLKLSPYEEGFELFAFTFGGFKKAQ